MLDYGWLVASILFLVITIINVVRWFVIRKDYKVSSFLVVIVDIIAFVVFLVLAMK